MEWVNSTDFPKVFKLRGGASSQNVRLVASKTEAARLVNQAFSGGFHGQRVLSEISNKLRLGFRKDTLLQKVLRSPKPLGRILRNRRARNKEKGYVYFQDFIPNNDHDIRIIIAGDRACGMKRLCRKNDFRASGSGDKVFDPSAIDQDCVRLAFNTADQLQLQSAAFDFIMDVNNTPLIVELSYGYHTLTYPGYWSRDLRWHEGWFNAPQFIAETFIKSITAVP